MPTRGANRRQQIIEAALDAIRASAVADVQLAGIAESAGMRPSHVLYYFGSREEVLSAAAQHAESTLAQGRAERLGEAGDQLRAFAELYLPRDRHDPLWKLRIEGWLRSSAPAHEGWLEDLLATAEQPEGWCRRLLFLLDGLALHVLSGHLAREDAVDLALTTPRG